MENPPPSPTKDSIISDTELERSSIDSSSSLGYDSPKNLHSFRKWIVVSILSSTVACVACAASAASFAEASEAKLFHVSKEAAILGVSLYVAALGCGPLILGPLSEFFGRYPVYCVSIACYWVFTWPVAFAPNFAIFCIFRFLSGFAGSAFLCVSGGGVSDMFTDETVATPMAVYTLCSFSSAFLGPLMSGFINQHLDWRWTYIVFIIWGFVNLILLILFVPETYEPVLAKRKSKRETGSLWRAMFLSCSTPFEILLFEKMALFLNLWTALVLGIIYLAFHAFPVIFESGHGFNKQMTGLTFLGIGVGMTIGVLTQPLWNRIYKTQTLKNGGKLPAEVLLLPGMPGGILFALSLLLLSVFSTQNITPALPLLFSIPLGLGTVLIYIAVFTYIVTAYRPVAASAMAANTTLRNVFAAVFPLFTDAMYTSLGSVNAGLVLGGIMTVAAFLPFFFFKYGAQIRQNSRFAKGST